MGRMPQGTTVTCVGRSKTAVPAAMPKKRPAACLDDDDDDDEKEEPMPVQAHRQPGFKDAKLLSSCLAPFIKKRHDMNYTSDRKIKNIQRQKLTNKCTSTDSASLCCAVFSIVLHLGHCFVVCCCGP